MEGDVITTQELFTYRFEGETADGRAERPLRIQRPAARISCPAPSISASTGSWRRWDVGQPDRCLRALPRLGRGRDRAQPVRHHRGAAAAAQAPQAAGPRRPAAYVGPARPRGRPADAPEAEAGEDRDPHPDRRAGEVHPAARHHAPARQLPPRRARLVGRDLRHHLARRRRPRDRRRRARPRQAARAQPRPRPLLRHARDRPLREDARQHEGEPLHEAAPRCDRHHHPRHPLGPAGHRVHGRRRAGVSTTRSAATSARSASG